MFSRWTPAIAAITDAGDMSRAVGALMTDNNK
jgi:hypothetical protein